MSLTEHKLRNELDEAETRLVLIKKAMAGEPYVAPLCLRLTKTEGLLLGVMMANEIATTHKMTMLCETTKRAINVHMHKMQKKLKPHGVKIGNRFDVGYYLTPDDKAKVRALS